MGCCCRKLRRRKAEPAKPLVQLTTKLAFEDVVGTDRLVVIDCYATWCRPCTKIAPKVEKMAVEFASKVEFYKIDVDINDETARSLEIHALPTFVIFTGGSEVARIVGADIEKVRASINKYSQPGAVVPSNRRVSNATRSSQSTSRIQVRKETIEEGTAAAAWAPWPSKLATKVSVFGQPSALAGNAGTRKDS